VGSQFSPDHEKSGQSQIDQFHPAESQPSAQGDGQQADIDRMIQGIFIVIFDVGQAQQERLIIYQVIKIRTESNAWWY